MGEGLKTEGLPFFEKGKPIQVHKVHEIDWLDIAPKLVGRPFGAQGIGKLRDVGLTKITPDENGGVSLLSKKYPEFTGYLPIDVERASEQQEDYAKVLRENGVRVHWIEFPIEPQSPFGPMISMWAAGEVLVLRVGSVLPKFAVNPFGFGRELILSKWLFCNLGIPPAGHIMGKGVNEVGLTMFPAENIAVVSRGAVSNDNGINQLVPILRMSGVKEVVLCDLPGYSYIFSGGLVHLDMVFASLGHKKVLIYPNGLSFSFIQWLKDRKFEIIEVDREDFENLAPNVTLIQPDKVIIIEGTKVARKIERSGVDVIELDYSEIATKRKGAFDCATMKIHREPGPGLEE